MIHRVAVSSVKSMWTEEIKAIMTWLLLIIICMHTCNSLTANFLVFLC